VFEKIDHWTVKAIDVKNVFYVFIHGTFVTFLTFFYIFFQRFFLFLKTFIFETTETIWVCMIVFLCAHVIVFIWTYILTSITV